MEARIFMKFKTCVRKIVVDHQPNFHKDPCKDARGRGENTPYKGSDPSQQKSAPHSLRYENRKYALTSPFQELRLVLRC